MHKIFRLYLLQIIYVLCLTFCGVIAYNSRCCLFGDIAQLGERLNGIQEVRGSNPLISIKIRYREDR